MGYADKYGIIYSIKLSATILSSTKLIIYCVTSIKIKLLDLKCSHATNKPYTEGIQYKQFCLRT